MRPDSPERNDLQVPLGSDPHPVEVLVASLLDPPDLDQRVQEYDWQVQPRGT